VETEIVTQTTEPAVIPESAPVTTETPEVTEVTEVTSAEAEPAATANSVEEEGAKPPKAVQELIDQRKKRQKAEQEAAYWRGRAEATVQPPPPAQAPPKPVAPEGPPVAPVLDSFETYTEYEAAKDEYLITAAEWRIRQRSLQHQQQQVQQQQTLQQIQLRQAFDKRIEDAAKEDPTIIDIVNDKTLPINRFVGDMIQQSDIAPQVLKYLHNHRDEAKTLNGMQPIQAARELGAIEARLKLSGKPAPPKKVSSAPDPIPAIKPSGAGIVDETNLPVDQWIARRNKEGKR
jgi:hypothetical protein